MLILIYSVSIILSELHFHHEVYFFNSRKILCTGLQNAFQVLQAVEVGK